VGAGAFAAVPRRGEAGGSVLRKSRISAISGGGGIGKARTKRAGSDIGDRQQAERTYNDWARQGRPTVK
jgi:hypothetical protein